MLGEGDERISALPLDSLLRPLALLVDHLLIETEPKEELYSTLKIADDMIALRSSEPVTVEMWCDRDALGPVSDFDKTPALLYLAEQVEVWPPSRLAVRVSYQHELEAVMAPRCLLAIVDPGIKHVAIPMNGAVLDAPLVNIAGVFQVRPIRGRGSAQQRLLEQLRRTAVAGLVCDKEADNTRDGQAERVSLLKEVRNGTFKVPELQPIHAIDAKLRDAIDETAPFAVLCFSSPREAVEPRVALSVRDADSGALLLADVVLRKDYFRKVYLNY